MVWALVLAQEAQNLDYDKLTMNLKELFDVGVKVCVGLKSMLGV